MDYSSKSLDMVSSYILYSYGFWPSNLLRTRLFFCDFELTLLTWTLVSSPTIPGLNSHLPMWNSRQLLIICVAIHDSKTDCEMGSLDQLPHTQKRKLKYLLYPHIIFDWLPTMRSCIVTTIPWNFSDSYWVLRPKFSWVVPFYLCL